MKRVTLAVNGFRVNEWRQFPPCSLNRGPSFLSRDYTCYWYWILCKKKKKGKKGLMNEQPWQRMEDVINYEAIVKSTHCYVWFKVCRSHRRRRLHIFRKNHTFEKFTFLSFFILIYWIIYWLRFIDTQERGNEKRRGLIKLII